MTSTVSIGSLSGGTVYKIIMHYELKIFIKSYFPKFFKLSELQLGLATGKRNTGSHINHNN